MERPRLTPAELISVKAPRWRDVQDYILTELKQDRATRKTVHRLGLTLWNIVKDIEHVRTSGGERQTHLWLAAMSFEQMTLLRALWGGDYVDKIIVTQILSQRGERIAILTHDTLKAWYEEPRKVRPSLAAIEYPSRQFIHDALQRVPPDIAAPDALESVRESLVAVSRTGADIDMDILRRVVREDLFFYNLIWGEDYVWQVQFQSRATSMDRQVCPARLLCMHSYVPSGQVLSFTAAELRARISELRGRAPREDEARRLRVQIWVATRTLDALEHETQRISRRFEGGNALDFAIDTRGRSGVTWRDRMEAILRRPSVQDVGNYIRRQRGWFVDTSIMAEDEQQQQHIGHNMGIHLDWVITFRGLVHQEFTVDGWASHENWILLAEELEQTRDGTELGIMSITLRNVMGDFPRDYELNESDRSVLRRAEAYCRLRARGARSGAVQRSGRLANLSAMRGLRRQAIVDMIDFITDLGKFLYGGDIGLPNRTMRRVEKIIRDTDSLYRQATRRIIQCSIGATISDSATTTACTKVALGECVRCATPLCGQKACSMAHEDGGCV